ncbi:hypothetical protein D3C84_828310 [compost metagenome]
MPISIPHIDCARRHVQQRQGALRLQRNAGRPRKIIGRAQRQQRQAGVAAGLDHGFGHVAQGAVATTGDQRPIPLSQGFLHQPPGVAAFPGQPHRKFPARSAACLHGRPHLIVGGLLAMQDQQGLALDHDHLRHTAIAGV